jgi:hypothetical protein
MFHSISWFDFLRILIFIVASYYFLLAAYYFKNEIFSVFSFRRMVSIPGPNIKTRDNSASDTSADDDENIPFTMIHELVEELKMLFKRASETRMVKEELLHAIRSRMTMYPRLRKTDLVDEINTHITQEAKEVCKMDIAPGDLEQIWAF